MEPFSIEYDGHGRFRIVAPDHTPGDWCPYTSAAVLLWQGKTYLAGSTYGILPGNEVVYEVRPLETRVRALGSQTGT